MLGALHNFLRALIALVLCLSILHADTLSHAEPEAVGMSAEKLQKVDHVIEDFIENKELAGAVTIIARKGKVVHFSAKGMQDIASAKVMEKDAIFRIYSMTKAVVSAAAMVLVERGKLNLDIPVSNYIPSIGKMKYKGSVPERAMTLRDLLRHSAGFPNNVSTDRALIKAGHPSLADSSLEEMMSRLDSVPLIYEP